MSEPLVETRRSVLTSDAPLTWYPARLETPEDEMEVHLGMEFGIVLEGELLRTLKGSKRLCRAGDTWFINAYELHGWKTTDRLPVRLLSVIFLPWAIGGSVFPGRINLHQLFLVEPGKRPACHEEAIRKDLLLQAEEMFRIPYNKDIFVQEALLLRLKLILLSILGGRDLPDKLASPSETMDRFVPHIKAILSDPSPRRGQAEVARMCHMSVSSFRNKFRTFMGTTYTEYQTRHRLSLVCGDLLLGKKIENIARDHGFTDSAHLNKTFRKHFGVSPGMYRKTGRLFN